MSLPRVLVIEDERKVLRGLERGLRAEGYDVVGAADGDLGLRQATDQTFQCIVLDLMLPGKDGLEVLAELRRSGRQVPVLVLTARDAVQDRVLGLDAGADDYLVKPFAFAELLARLRVLLRRGLADDTMVIAAGGLRLDLVRRRATNQGRDVSLTQREFDLLEYLLRHRDHIVTRDMLGRDVWHDPNFALTNVIDVYINLLRRKLDRPGAPSVIQTIRGVGYRLQDEP